MDATLLPLQAETDWAFVWRQRQFFVEGTWIAVQLTFFSIVLGFLLGLPAGVAEAYGGRYSKGVVRPVGVALRGTPILVIIAITYFAVGVSPVFLAATVALGLRSAAYQSQIFRGAIESVSGGQMEAARAVGLSKLEAIRHVVLPQALRRSVPGFQNEFTIVLKDTSIAYAIGVAELLKRSSDLYSIRTSAALEVFLAASAIYFVLTFTVNRGIEAVHRHVAIPGGETQ
ncbi:amino acid ABC transporter permease [Halobacterium litoreum]|uniref:Amino acid ABC transporter permease n=1 Tax=Halobacterium litoreum TaxID=2039234 RepID=A0ABD5NCP9_9EURY|nr:amino acid ABC transporter permease [Halobacterium litoreum]UHH14043.1 amino acid ABC transporter permease [Halobacterium litoreum]